MIWYHCLYHSLIIIIMVDDTGGDRCCDVNVMLCWIWLSSVWGDTGRCTGPGSLSSSPAELYWHDSLLITPITQIISLQQTISINTPSFQHHHHHLRTQTQHSLNILIQLAAHVSGQEMKIMLRLSRYWVISGRDSMSSDYEGRLVVKLL